MEVSKFSRGEGGDFTPAPAGVHSAVCYAVIDLGTQESVFQGKTSLKPKILIRWELDERDEDGRRFMIQQRYTASMHEKSTLRKHLEAWRGQKFTDEELSKGGFKMENLLGKGCQIQIVHDDKDGKTYANIAAIMKLAKGMKPLKPEIEPFIFDLDAFDRETYEALTDGMKNIIARSPEFQALLKDRSKSNGRVAHDEPDDPDDGFDPDLEDEIPFDAALAA